MEKDDEKQNLDQNEKEHELPNEKDGEAMSCEDKSKLAVGPPIVNRFWNISSKFFMQGGHVLDDEAGLRVLPNGYMEGSFKNRESGEKESSTEVEKDAIDDEEKREAAMAMVSQHVDGIKKI